MTNADAGSKVFCKEATIRSQSLNAILQRVRILLNRCRRAKRLGVEFTRYSSFRLPTSIVLAGRRVPLRLPDDAGSRSAFVDILLDDCYGLKNLPDDAAIVLDIGAHAGLFSLAARIRWPRAVIHAYEPNPAMRPFLDHQAGLAGFQVFPEALGATEGLVTLDPGDDSVQTRVHADERGKIPCVTLAAAVSRLGGRVDLVKMDCEGAEKVLLEDAGAWRNVHHVTMEYHLWAGYSLPELKAWVGRAGFVPGKVTPIGETFGLLFASRATSAS